MDDLNRQIRLVALALYRWSGWQTLPWGPKQVLSGFIADVIDAESAAAKLKCEEAEREAEKKRAIEAAKPKPKRLPPVPWER